ncbi:MAG: hypothetical protein KAI71_03460 [Candidatus Pacebacteria bacterium]|nr:hypothetical protein [Candidatus Paceibacterota bacterium]
MNSKYFSNVLIISFTIFSFSFFSTSLVKAECGSTVGTLEKIEICDVGAAAAAITTNVQARGGAMTCADLGDTSATAAATVLWCTADCTIDTNHVGNVCFGGYNIGTAPDDAPTDFDDALLKIINWVLGFAASIATLALVWGGFQYMTSAGDESKAENGKKTISYGLIGLFIAGIAFAIVNVIVATILA